MKIIEHTFNSTGTRKSTKGIILHCSATAEGKDYTVDTINQWHKSRGFQCIGYNFVVYRDGTIHRGRSENALGAHTTNHNSISIGICYIGGCDETGKKAKDTRTPAQKEAICELVKYITEKYKLGISDVHGHYEFAAKACPSFKMDTFRKEYSEWMNKKHVCPTCGQEIKNK